MMPFLRRTLVPALVFAGGLGCGGGATAPLPDGGRRVLFIGNSLTASNDLPRTIAGLARAVGEAPLVYRTVARPDFSLEDHWRTGVVDRIARDGWQVVVMQQGPSTLLASQEHLRIWAAELDRSVAAAGARSALAMVWPVAGQPGGFDAVRTAYRNAALTVGGIFIPAGEAWRTAWAADSTLALYGFDGFHPTALGTYVAALVHFEMLYGRPATDLPDIAVVDGRPLDLPPATVARLQQAAHETVLAHGIP